MNIKRVFLVITFTWSYSFWLVAIYLSNLFDLAIIPNEVLLLTALQGDLDISSQQLIVNLTSLTAVFGPMIAAISIFIVDKKANLKFRRLFKRDFGYKNLLEIILIILMIGVLPSIIIGLINSSFNLDISLGLFVFFSIILFFFQLFTSGTEEIGWRGYLLPEYLDEGMTMWKSSLKVGVIWAVWHYPIFIYLYWLQGFPIFMIILSLFGFTVGTVGMSVIHTYYLAKSRSVILSMIIHALYNTIPLLIGLLITSSYIAAFITQIGIWVVIWFIEKREGKIFDKMLNLNN
jgi:membrane protease YdiL (CAAX protease family)